MAITLLSAATTTGAGGRVSSSAGPKTFQAFGTTTAGSGAATVTVQVSNADSPTENDWLTLGTITLTLGTTSTSDGFASNAPWQHYRGNLTAISGTNAAVTLKMGG